MVSFRKAFNDDYFSNIFMFEVQENWLYIKNLNNALCSYKLRIVSFKFSPSVKKSSEKIRTDFTNTAVKSCAA